MHLVVSLLEASGPFFALFIDFYAFRCQKDNEKKVVWVACGQGKTYRKNSV